MKFRLDSDWVKGDYNNKYYSVYNYNNSCSVTIEIMGYYDDDEYSKDILDNYNSNNKINNIKINDIEYKMLNIDNNYIYTTYIDNDLYIVLFDIYNNYDICNKYKDDILKSITVYE